MTPRIAEVAELMKHGWCDKEIARELGLSVKTAQCYASQVIFDLGVENRTQAALSLNGIKFRRPDEYHAMPTLQR